MQNLDTLKLRLSQNCIKNINSFIKKEISSPVDTIKGRKIVGTHYSYPNRKLGLNHFEIRDSGYGMEIIIEISAKILKEHYFELININNISLVIKNLNDSIIGFKEEEFLKAQVLRADIANHLCLSGSPDKYISMLNYSLTNTRYILEPYGKNGIVFIKGNKTKSIRDRIIFYDKSFEILKDREICKYIDSDIFNNILKVESNLRSFSQMRRLLNIEGEITLKKVLESEEKVNYKLLEDITGKNNMEFFDNYKDKKLSEIEKMEGRKSIIKNAKGNYITIRNFIKEHHGAKSNFSKTFSEYKKIQVSLKNKDKPLHSSNFDLLEELKSSLLET